LSPRPRSPCPRLKVIKKFGFCHCAAKFSGGAPRRKHIERAGYPSFAPFHAIPFSTINEYKSDVRIGV
jgi:hypothetical protein